MRGEDWVYVRSGVAAQCSLEPNSGRAALSYRLQGVLQELRGSFWLHPVQTVGRTGKETWLQTVADDWDHALAIYRVSLTCPALGQWASGMLERASLSARLTCCVFGLFILLPWLSWDRVQGHSDKSLLGGWCNPQHFPLLGFSQFWKHCNTIKSMYGPFPVCACSRLQGGILELMTWVQIPAPLLMNYVTLGLVYSFISCLNLKNGTNNDTS